MRADKAKSIDLITAEIVKNPLATMDEIGKAVGINKSNVSRNMPEVQQNATKDSRIISLTETDYEIVQLTQSRTLDRLRSDEEAAKITARDFTYIGDVSARRYSLLTGNATDPKGGLNMTKNLSDEELLKLVDGN